MCTYVGCAIADSIEFNLKRVVVVVGREEVDVAFGDDYAW